MKRFLTALGAVSVVLLSINPTVFAATAPNTSTIAPPLMQRIRALLPTSQMLTNAKFNFSGKSFALTRK